MEFISGFLVLLRKLFGLISIVFFSYSLYKGVKEKRHKENKKLIPLSIFMICISLFVFLVSSEESKGNTVVMDSQENTFNLKNTIVAGNVEYTVQSIDKKKNYKNEYGDKEKPFGEYLIVDVEIKNNHQYPLPIYVSEYDGTTFMLKNKDSYYRLNRSDSLSLTDIEYDDPSYIHNDINPGIAMSAQIVFDIPKEIIDSKDLELLIFTDDSAPDNIYVTVN